MPFVAFVSNCKQGVMLALLFLLMSDGDASAMNRLPFEEKISFFNNSICWLFTASNDGGFCCCCMTSFVVVFSNCCCCGGETIFVVTAPSSSLPNCNCC